MDRLIPRDPDTFRVISLGAGVQSTAMVLMSICGEFCPEPDCAIFADTGWEPPGVYAQLKRLEEFAAAAGFPIFRCSAGDIRSDHLAAAGDVGGRTFMPFFLAAAPDSVSGRGGMIRRKCSSEYKIQPIKRKIKSLLGFDETKAWPKGGPVVEQWIGFSVDEAQRCRPAPEPWITTVFPLIQAGMSRDDCVRYCMDVGFGKPARSSCVGCPYHSKSYWEQMAKNDPSAFADACSFDEEMRKRGGLPGVRGVPFLHPDRKPLREAVRDYNEGGTFEWIDGGCGGMCDT